MREVMYSKCCVPECRAILGCYDSDRVPKNKVCKDGCLGPCPYPAGPDSHGICAYHSWLALNESREKRNAKNNTCKQK